MFQLISIHALREEGDAGREGRRGRPGNFYPRPPRGGRLQLPHGCQPGLEFLSTPSARRATRSLIQRSMSFKNFYPRPPRGGRRGRSSNAQCPSKISIHALREEGDTIQSVDKTSTQSFLSTPSARRATRQAFQVQKYYEISIHALREEGDLGRGSSKQSMANFYPRPPRGGRLRHSSKLQQDKGYFYPRPPRGGRLCIPCACWLCPRFLSTPSARRATAHKCPHCAGLHISIHALREEGDLPWLSLCSAIGKFLSTPSARRATDAPLIWATSLMYFYPRPLRGGRQPSVSAPGCNYIFLSTPSARRATGESCHRGCRRDISIHALCEEGDAWARPRPACSGDFYPRPLRGGRRRSGRCSRGCCYFYPRPLRGGRLGVVVVGGIVDNISIHALREEGDGVWIFDGLKCTLFLSTPSARRATPCSFSPGQSTGNFYPRPLRGGRRMGSTTASVLR